MNTIEFNHTIDEMSGGLKPYALKLTHDIEEAKDLLQDTIFKAIKNREKFSEGTNLKAWLYTIMKNTFITNYQRMVRRSTFIDSTDNLHFINSTNSVISNLAYSKFANEDIKEALMDLSATYREPFLMYFRGFKYHEIALELNVPIGTVKNRIHIARKELKKQLTAYTYSN